MSTTQQAIEALGTPEKPMLTWYVTGTYHGSHVYARSEGAARRRFHEYYNGESIIHCTTKRYTPSHDED